MAQALIELSNLSQAYGDVVALQDLSGAVPPGSIGLVGSNGAGKSTLIKTLLGILHPTAGTASVLGLSVIDDIIEMRAKVGYMPERGGLPLDQAAADFMIYAAELAGLPESAARQRASDVLTLVGLHEERFRQLGDFSTGMKQRALLAQAIVHDPELVFLDEPLSGLDPEGRDEMLRLIGRLKGFGINTLVSSHVLADIESTCDWIVMLEGGRLVRNSALDEFTDVRTIQLEVFSGADALVRSLEGRGGTVRREGLRMEVSHDGQDPYPLVIEALAESNSSLRLLRPSVTTLEDVFLQQDSTPHPEDQS